MLPGIEADEPQHLTGALPAALRVPAEQPGHEGDVLAHAEVGQQPHPLDGVPDAAPEFDRVPGGDFTAGDEHLAGIRVHEPVHEPEEGRLAAAAPAEQDQDLSGRHVE